MRPRYNLWIASLEFFAFAPSSQVICSAFRPSIADHVLSATTATPVETCTTLFTPRTAFAFVPSKLFTVPPNTGHRATTACIIFGWRTSIPNGATPFTFIRESIRFVAFPTYLYSFASFRFGLTGTGSFAASSTSAPYPIRLPEAVFTTALLSVWHALGSTLHRFAAAAISISRAAAPAFASGSHDPRTLVLPPVPCRPKTGLKYCGAAGANSVLIFFQSRSSSSARIIVSAVLIPWPISDLSISSVVVSSGAICTHALIAAGSFGGVAARASYFPGK